MQKLQHLAKKGFSDSQSESQSQQQSQQQQLSSSTTPLLNRSTNISHMNADVQQAINYHTIIQKMEEQIKHYPNLIKEKSEEIAILRTQAQHFSQEAKKPLNSHTKHVLQEASKIKHLRMKQAEEAIRLYMEMVNETNEVIRQCHTKMMEKEGK